jgi:hypothetical protein
MNKILIVLTTLLISSCANNASNNKTEIVEEDITSTDGHKVDSTLYVYTNNRKDTVIMRIVNNKGKVDGTLMYNYFEKDKNTGTLTGNMQGDTLIADYIFMSEGVQSVREVAFVKKDNAWLQGYGEMVQEGNKMKFTDRNKLVFDTVNKLEQKSE